MCGDATPPDRSPRHRAGRQRLQRRFACRPARGRITRDLELLEQPIATAEFLVVDTETNGLGGDACELTEVGAVLVGGGELHDRWSSLVRTSVPLRRGIQRFTGITQAMVDDAPAARGGAAAVRASSCAAGVLVAHNAPFDRRVLRQAFERIGLEWPDPPVLCTAALARDAAAAPARAPAGRARRRARDRGRRSRTGRCRTPRRARACCARCSRGCARTRRRSRDALALLSPRRPRARAPSARRRRGRLGQRPQLDFAELPRRPGRVPVPRRRAAGRCTSASRSRSAAARGPTSRPSTRAGRLEPRTRRSSTTARRTRSSARWCSRTA